jgi:hypothetical protein
MARTKYADGTHRRWVRINDETEDALGYMAVDARAQSVEVLAGQLLMKAASEYMREKHKRPKPAKRKQ